MSAVFVPNPMAWLATTRVWHGFGNTHGFGSRVSGGTGKGLTFHTLIKPLPVWWVKGLCMQELYLGPGPDLVYCTIYI